MKTQATIPLIITLLLFLGSAALAQPGELPDGYAIEPELSLRVVQGTASGGGYQVLSLSWQVSGMASGQGYRLLSPLAPSLRGSGCCCTYLPCVGHNYLPGH